MRRATKDEHEKTEEEVERLTGPSPTFKPTRDDKKRRRIKKDDPDVEGDPDVSEDPDMSLNYKDVGGSTRRAEYRGSPPPLPQERIRGNIADGADLNVDDMKTIVSEAMKWHGEPFMKDLMTESWRDMSLRIALDYGIQTASDGRYVRSVDAPSYNLMLEALDRVV